LAGAVLGGGGVELGDPVEDELPDPLVAPGLAAPELAVAGLDVAVLEALVVGVANARAAEAPVPLLQPQPQNARAIRKNGARNDSEF
jgi:hypothetical protein